MRLFKQWHWTAIGFAGGVMLGVAALLAARDEMVGGAGFISQEAFEQALQAPSIHGNAYITSIVVHPAPVVDLLTMELLDPSTLRYQTVRLAAPRPYTPKYGTFPGRPPYSVRDYLQELSLRNHTAAPVYAWWDRPWAVLAIWTAGGGVVGGGIWPLLLRLFVGAAPDREREGFHLGNVASERRVSERPPMTDLTRRRLEELEAEMMAGLASVGANSTARAVVAPLKLRQLAGDEFVARTQAVVEHKEYAGEYYPVEKNEPGAFSLVELLVVMGIISILIALLMPALTLAQRHAQTVQCASNLRQVGMALQMYANNNRNWLPAWSGWHTWPAGQSDDSVGPAWTLELIPYIGTPDSNVYHCPAFRSAVPRRNYFLAAQWAGRSGRHAMKLSDVSMSTRFVLSGDKTQRQLYPPTFGTNEHLQDDADPDDSGNGMPVLGWPWDPGGFYMHPNGNNILFDDMHVALFDRYDPNAMTFNPKKMENWADVTGERQDAGTGGGP